jgi:hypothetical protein
MANTDLGALLEHAQVRLPGALPETIKLELDALMNDFCDATNVWNLGIPFTTQPNVTDYELTVNNGLINRVLNVVGADNRVMPATFQMPDTLSLVHTPTSEQELTVNVGLIPDNSSPLEVPCWIYAQYRNCLLDGVIGRMMSQTSKPYSNDKAAVFHLRNYAKGAQQAKNDVLHQFMFRGQGWMFPQSIRTRNQRGWIW